MNSKPHPALRSFANWLRETDDHADHHLALIRRADRALDEGRAANEGSRALADKLERWRYQHLRERAPQLTSRDEAFVDSLDLTANRLAGRKPRPPRQTRHALRTDSFDTDAMREAAEALDPRYPLERLVDRARRLTVDHFGSGADDSGRRVLLYAPLYVSSQCVNDCTYCGFRYPLDIERRHLSLREVTEEMALLRSYGFRHLLVVGGDFPQLTSTDYHRDVARTVVEGGIDPAIEIAPQSTASYETLVNAGVVGLTLYQETYLERWYAEYHVRGPKSLYHWRLESHDRAAEAGMPRLGLGVLLGLADTRQDVWAMLRHAAYLQNRFPDRTLAFSLPRIHEAPRDFTVPFPVSDEQLIRLYGVLRLGFPRAELVLSTREPVGLRNRLAEICITQMSAGSCTTPGGYGRDPAGSGQQFPVADDRSPAEVAKWLEQAGLRVQWSI